jgi:hypothetical protein
LAFPVFNGQTYLRRALGFDTRQEYPTTRSFISVQRVYRRPADMPRAFAGRVELQYFRNESNLRGGPYFNRVFELSRGGYFKWLYCDERMLSRNAQSMREMSCPGPLRRLPFVYPRARSSTRQTALLGPLFEHVRSRSGFSPSRWPRVLVKVTLFFQLLRRHSSPRICGRNECGDPHKR